MTPLSFEWLWNSEYFIFMGFLYLALLVVGCGLIYAWIKTWWDIDVRKENQKQETSTELSHRSNYSSY